MTHKPKVTGNKRAPAQKAGALLFLLDGDVVVLGVPSFRDVPADEQRNGRSRQHNQQDTPKPAPAFPAQRWGYSDGNHPVLGGFILGGDYISYGAGEVVSCNAAYLVNPAYLDGGDIG